MQSDAPASCSAAIAPNGDIHGPVSAADNAPERSRARVTEHRTVPATKDRGHPSPLIAESGMADGVHAAMNAVQATSRHATLDGARVGTHGAELGRRDNAMLPGRNLSDSVI
jgi:hypothetical protein